MSSEDDNSKISIRAKIGWGFFLGSLTIIFLVFTLMASGRQLTGAAIFMLIISILLFIALIWIEIK